MSSTQRKYHRTEIVIVLLVIAALAALSIPCYRKAQRMTKERACHDNIASIERDVEVYQLAGDESLPASLDQLYGAGKVKDEIPLCPLNGHYSLANGNVVCDHPAP